MTDETKKVTIIVEDSETIKTIVAYRSRKSTLVVDNFIDDQDLADLLSKEITVHGKRLTLHLDLESDENEDHEFVSYFVELKTKKKTRRRRS